MKNLHLPIKSTIAIVTLAILFLMSCEDTSNTNTDPPTDPTEVETPPPPQDDREAIYLQGVYATSNDDFVKNIFDGNTSTIWKTKKGAGPDEGIMLYFQNKTFLQKIEIDFGKGSDLTGTIQYDLFGNGALIEYSATDKIGNLNNEYTSLFIRLGRPDDIEMVTVEDDSKIGSVLKFPKDKSIGISDVRIFGEDGKELRIVPPREIKATIEASSTLKPYLAYNTSKLFDTRKEFAWVEGAPAFGHGEKLTFNLSEDAKIDKVKLWNGYQRSPNHYKANARLRGFTLGKIGGKPYEYTLRDDLAGQMIDLTVPLKGKQFEFIVKSSFKGRSYQDLAISEMLFYEDGKPLVLNVANNFPKEEIVDKANGTILESLLDYRVANEMEYTVSGIFANRSIILRSDGTFVMYLDESDSDGEGFLSIADGNWNIITADDKEAKVKIFGKILDMSAIEAYYAGTNEQAELYRIFKDELTINNNKITGEKVLDEIIIR